MIGVLITTELTKIFRKWRTYIGFMVLAFLVGVVQTAMYFEGPDAVNMANRSFADSFIMTGNLLNGYFIGNILLNSLIIHIPFLIVLVGGDLLAGEATHGTYRMLLTRPISRINVLIAKFLSSFIYTAIFMIFMFALSVGLSLIIFGSGELIVFKDKIYIYGTNDILWRFLMAYGFATLSMATIIALSILFSSLVENAIGPIITTMAVLIVSLILSNLNIGFFEKLQPYLFTTYTNDWNYFFEDPVKYDEIVKSAGVLLLYILSIFGITSYIFTKKDILS
ncbi:MAG TPA: ABC transporter permease subunit [Melioribacteraceae bacterium]|nr:ABC transporter permease subunit [Melioribacteraceae bacterium]